MNGDYDAEVGDWAYLVLIAALAVTVAAVWFLAGLLLGVALVR